MKITSRVDGIIRSIAKRPGEFVHAGEKIMEIQSTEKVRLEGNLDVQYFDRVKRHMEVAIEPAIPSAPVNSHSWHRAEVGRHRRDRTRQTPARRLRQPGWLRLALGPEPDQRIRAACSAATLAAAPGWRPQRRRVRLPARRRFSSSPARKTARLRIWDVTDVAKLPKTPTREASENHGSGVHAIAVSPDGKYAVTAAGREVFIWELASRQETLRLAAGTPRHRDLRGVHAANSVGDGVERQLPQGVETGDREGRGHQDGGSPLRRGRNPGRQPRRRPGSLRSGQEPHRPHHADRCPDHRPVDERRSEHFVHLAGDFRAGPQPTRHGRRQVASVRHRHRRRRRRPQGRTPGVAIAARAGAGPPKSDGS